jgi:hypothetical protein
MRLICLSGLCLALLAPAAARARPATKVYDMKAGKEEFFRAVVKAVVVDDPSVLTAELMPSQEVMLTAVKPGRALLVLFTETSVDAVRVRVFSEGRVPEVHATEAQRAAATKACPGLKEEGSETERRLTATVATPACRAALRELFDADEYSTRNLELIFSQEVVLNQLEAIRLALKAKGLDQAVQAGYKGAELSLKGKVTEAQRAELAKALFDAVVGQILLEDSLEIVEVPKPAPVEKTPEPTPPDAGWLPPVQRGFPKTKVH